MKATVQYLDGSEKEAQIIPKAIIMTERKFDKASSQLFDFETARADYNYYVAWAAVFCAGVEKEPDYEKWLDSVSEVVLDPEMEEEEEDSQGKSEPTQKAPTRKKSSS